MVIHVVMVGEGEDRVPLMAWPESEHDRAVDQAADEGGVVVDVPLVAASRRRRAPRERLAS